MFKLTNRTKTEELKDMFRQNFGNIAKADKSLAERIKYASTHQATRADLMSLAKETVALMGDKLTVTATAEVKKTAAEKTTEAPAPAEKKTEVPKKSTTTKKGETKKSEAPAKVTETPAEKTTKVAPKSENLTKVKKSSTKKSTGETQTTEAPAKAAEKPAPAPKEAVKTAKKTSGKKTTEKKVAEKPKEVITTAEVVTAFPKTIEVEGDTYKLLLDEVKNMNDLYKLVTTTDDGADNILFAYVWTKSDLKQFIYFDGKVGQPKSFKNDLDLCSIVYISDAKKMVYTVSLYTECFYECFAPAINIDEGGVRYSNGIPYAIYMKQ